MRVLITGITGFSGSHLADYIVKNIDEAEVYGAVRWRSNRGNLSLIENRIKFCECELRDTKSVWDLIEYVKPKYIFHLAGHSYVPASWNSPNDTVVNNIIGQINILEAIRKASPDCRVLIACSSEEYGLVFDNELPIKEENPLRPLSPHGVSKAAQDFLGFQYFNSYGLDIIRTRAFNHTGPRQGELFVASNFARQVAEIELGIRIPIVYVGNLDSQRDFTDVRDVVRGYWLALQKGKAGEVYQICSGSAYTIRKVLQILMGYSKKEIDVRADPTRIRPSDVPLLLGTYKKFNKATGWEPLIPFERTLADLLDYWRERLKKQTS
ncbi:MAG: GDP-mannose 4,6-dehydratase [Bacillota bacterium]